MATKLYAWNVGWVKIFSKKTQTVAYTQNKDGAKPFTDENEMLRCASIIEREGHHLDKVKCAVPDWIMEDA